MINGKSILAIIPARGGSKGIPNKNIKMLCGKPLVTWTIEAAKKSVHLDRIIVSTDSEEIADVAKEYGAEVPFLRPAELSTDETKGDDVVLHALNWVKENEGELYDYFVLLQPTSPFRTSRHIDDAIQLFNKSKEASSLVSVSEVIKHPVWMKRIDEKGFLVEFIKTDKLYFKTDKLYSRRQELPPLYVLNGAIYLAKWDEYFVLKSFFNNKCLPFVMDHKAGLDIDTLDDWDFAEYYLLRN